MKIFKFISKYNFLDKKLYLLATFLLSNWFGRKLLSYKKLNVANIRYIKWKNSISFFLCIGVLFSSSFYLFLSFIDIANIIRSYGIKQELNGYVDKTSSALNEFYVENDWLLSVDLIWGSIIVLVPISFILFWIHFDLFVKTLSIHIGFFLMFSLFYVSEFLMMVHDISSLNFIFYFYIIIGLIPLVYLLYIYCSIYIIKIKFNSKKYI